MSPSGADEDALTRRRGIREQPWRFVVTAAILMIVAYSLLYFPYPPDTAPVRFLSWYLRQVTQASGAIARWVDDDAVVAGDLIQGRFALRIVLDCAALDTHAFYASAVLAFPATWKQRALGALVGSTALAVVNVLRIASLYVVGLHWPSVFHTLHEEVFQFAIVLLTFGAFWMWTAWARHASAQSA